MKKGKKSKENVKKVTTKYTNGRSMEFDQQCMECGIAIKKKTEDYVLYYFQGDRLPICKKCFKKFVGERKYDLFYNTNTNKWNKVKKHIKKKYYSKTKSGSFVKNENNSSPRLSSLS